MNTSSVAVSRIVVAMHHRYRQDPEYWQAVRASLARGRRQAKRSRRIDQCGTSEPCGICRDALHLLPMCARHGVPAGEPCGPCLSVLDRAYLFAAGTAGEVAA